MINVGLDPVPVE